jgi:hypothetical protein
MPKRRPRYCLVLLPLLLGLIGAACKQYANLGDDYPEECPGQCVKLPPLGFDGPALLWVGAAAEVPECPARAPTLVFDGFDGLQDAPLDCPACECSQPTCAFPAGLTAYSLPICQGSPTDFLAPVPWSGACTSPAVLTSSEFQSMAVAAPTEQPCAPIMDLPQKEQPPAAYTVAARACLGEVYPDKCPDVGDTCLPTAEPPPPGFRQCIIYLYEGDTECPDSYPDKVKPYSGMEDSRACTECTCTKTASADCVAQWSAYQDTVCGASLFTGMIAMGGMSGCPGPGMPGAQLGSMSATWLVNEPGACQAGGGEPTGKVTGINQRVFCCQGAFESVP